MGSAARIRVAAQISAEQHAKRPVVTVVSAMAKITDLLLDSLRKAEAGDEAGLDAALSPALVEIDAIAAGERDDGRHGAAVLDVGAARPRIEEHGKRQPRIVGHAVMVVQHGGEVFLAQPGKLSNVVVVEPAACRQSIPE